MINEIKAKLYCKEDISKIENYDTAVNDKTETWDVHHRLELHPDNSTRFTRESLKRLDLYYNVEADKLIFLKRKEHLQMHKKGKQLSEEHRRKIGEAKKGNTYRVGKTMTAESRIKMSVAKKGNTYNKGKTNSVFGKAFKEHYGITRCDNEKLYNKEYKFYKIHNNFSWEV